MCAARRQTPPCRSVAAPTGRFRSEFRRGLRSVSYAFQSVDAYIFGYCVGLTLEQTVYSAHSLHRRIGECDDVLATSDGNEFKPSRWESLEHDSWEYIPFNNGPLTCLGRAFGQLSIEWVLVRLFQIFDRIEPGDDRTRAGAINQRIELNSKPAQRIMCMFHKVENQ